MCAVYEKYLVCDMLNSFFVVPLVCSIPELQEMTIFDKYLCGMWPPAIHTPNFSAMIRLVLV